MLIVYQYESTVCFASNIPGRTHARQRHVCATRAANDHSAVAEFNFTGPRDSISGYVAVKGPGSGAIGLETFKQAYGIEFSVGQGWRGQTLYERWPGRDPVVGGSYSSIDETQMFVATDQSDEEAAKSAYH